MASGPAPRPSTTSPASWIRKCCGSPASRDCGLIAMRSRMAGGALVMPALRPAAPRASRRRPSGNWPPCATGSSAPASHPERILLDPGFGFGTPSPATWPSGRPCPACPKPWTGRWSGSASGSRASASWPGGPAPPRCPPDQRDRLTAPGPPGGHGHGLPGVPDPFPGALRRIVLDNGTIRHLRRIAHGPEVFRHRRNSRARLRLAPDPGRGRPLGPGLGPGGPAPGASRNWSSAGIPGSAPNPWPRPSWPAWSGRLRLCVLGLVPTPAVAYAAATRPGAWGLMHQRQPQPARGQRHQGLRRQGRKALRRGRGRRGGGVRDPARRARPRPARWPSRSDVSDGLHPATWAAWTCPPGSASWWTAPTAPPPPGPPCCSGARGSTGWACRPTARGSTSASAPPTWTRLAAKVRERGRQPGRRLRRRRRPLPHGGRRRRPGGRRPAALAAGPGPAPRPAGPCRAWWARS